MADVTVKQKREFNRLLISARQYEAAGSLREALPLYEKCAAIRVNDPKLEKKIRILRGKIKALPPELPPPAGAPCTSPPPPPSEPLHKSPSPNPPQKTPSPPPQKHSEPTLLHKSPPSDIETIDIDDKPPEIEFTVQEPAPATTPIKIKGDENSDNNEHSHSKRTNTKSHRKSEKPQKEFVDVNIGSLRIPSELYERLYGYQKEGVKWLWGLHNTKPHGGILCDDMGLGKTIQVSTFLVGLMRGKVLKRPLLLSPSLSCTSGKRSLHGGLQASRSPCSTAAAAQGGQAPAPASG